MILPKRKKGQAALDYMFTYGWAFLGILIALGVLTYFGVFDVDRFRFQECIFPPGAFCDDFIITDTIDLIGLGDDEALHLDVVNAFGADLTINHINMSALEFASSPISCSWTATPSLTSVTLSAFPTNWDSETTIYVVCPVPPGDFFTGETYDITVAIAFEQQAVAGYSYSISGLVQARAQT